MGATILGIHSNVTGGDKTGGHAWISVRLHGTTTTFGLWPDEHPMTEDNGPGFDIRRNLESNSQAAVSRYYELTNNQALKLWVEIRSNQTWQYRFNCSSWATHVAKQVIGKDLNSGDRMLLGISTPRQLGQSLQELERTDPTSRLSPKVLSEEDNQRSSSFSIF